MDWEQIGKIISDARKKKGLFQKDVAKVLGISNAAYWKYENGRCCVPFENLKKICTLLNINISTL